MSLKVYICQLLKYNFKHFSFDLLTGKTEKHFVFEVTLYSEDKIKALGLDEIM